MPNGDETIVWSKGITPSGGQKQSLAIARALYAKGDVVFLDDVFSGLDTDTEEQIFSKLFTRSGLFRKLVTTAIFVTHAVHRLPYADYLISLSSNGATAEQGTYESLTLRMLTAPKESTIYRDSTSPAGSQSSETVGRAVLFPKAGAVTLDRLKAEPLHTSSTLTPRETRLRPADLFDLAFGQIPLDRQQVPSAGEGI